MNKQKLLIRFILSSLLLLACAMPIMAGEIKASYLYTLSDFNGPIPYNWVNLAADPERRETYVADSGDKTVRVFNESGMEIYRFGDNGELGAISAVAVAGNGDIYVLSRTNVAYGITRCNFRGDPQGKMELKNLPPEYVADFLPDYIMHRDGHLYLVDRTSMKVVLTDLHGVFENGYDLGAILGFDAKKRRETGIVGFTVDRQGDFLFTIPAYFSAYIMTPDKKVRLFGTRGSSPGKFNIVSGIAADDQGNVYVSDTLRCVIIVFDKDFNFRTEFGYRGFDPGNLIAPMEIVVNNDRVYVSQTRSRGVSVYRIFSN
jgi:DNA-binding beta-propeller fold protein YncE